MFLGEAAGYQAAAAPGLHVALCNEPVADMNMIVVGARAEPASLIRAARDCLDRSLPFLTVIFPEAGQALDDAAGGLGLVHAVDFPFMVRDDAPIEPLGHPDAEVTRAVGPEDAEASAAMLESAFSMPRDAVLRALPASLCDSPGVDVFVARMDGQPVGTVTLTYHGDTCGIWAMGTDRGRQRGGVGRRLLSSAIADARNRGLQRFFLGATPAGYGLYESLGFVTRVTARVWVSGETHQA